MSSIPLCGAPGAWRTVYGAPVDRLDLQALVTLAALTLDEKEKNGLFNRASAEGVNVNDLDTDENLYDTVMHDAD